MSPAPTSYHQKVIREFLGALYIFLKRQVCQYFCAPIDVRLMRTHGGESVVQPDLCVICDLSKIHVRGCVEASDFIIEFLSLGNSRRKLKDKFALYKESGVGEYWIIDPQRRSVERYILPDGQRVGLRSCTDEDEAITATDWEGFSVSGI